MEIVGENIIFHWLQIIFESLVANNIFSSVAFNDRVNQPECKNKFYIHKF